MLVVTRFSAPGPHFVAEARSVIDWWAARPGCLAMELVRNLDDPDLFALVSRWASVGEYRRSFNGYEAKMILTPLLSRAVDEPSAYLPVDEVGDNRPRGTY
ncbi:antibiotic biosynthesis monooxygenase [Tessaracoccus sp. MC1627]|uniref:antibiotic biosynthesis monooxygenase family protein n=1 Tax=Tessaracoccus sp. MC1627 TaxID=2760312 RepID=UPI001602D52D|nr:antibiotic biosynthesis monooxygenase [Tessaracoccus sp. MC1627]